MSDADKSRFASFFLSVRDKPRYQGADRAGTYLNYNEHFSAKLIYDDDDDYQNRYRLCRTVLNVPGDGRHVPLWREQFDHAPMDLLSSLRHFGCDNALDSLRNESWTKLQKWLIANRHNEDDVKLMGWLMTEPVTVRLMYVVKT